MNSHRDQRQNHAVQHVKTQQRVGVHGIAAQHQEAHLRAQHRHRRHDIRAHRDRPECQLIPRQQVAGVAEKQRHHQQHYADHPVEFARRAVRSAVEHLEHVREHQQHHGVRRPAMQIAQKHARRKPRTADPSYPRKLAAPTDGSTASAECRSPPESGNSQAERAEIPRDAEVQRPSPHLDRSQMQEDVLLDGQRAVQVAFARSRREIWSARRAFRADRRDAVSEFAMSGPHELPCDRVARSGRPAGRLRR